MASTVFYEEEAQDLEKRDQRLTLEIAEIHGRIVISVGPVDDVVNRWRASLDVKEARKALQALDDAVARIGYTPTH